MGYASAYSFPNSPQDRWSLHPRARWGPIVLFVFPWIPFNVYFSSSPGVEAALAFRVDQKNSGLFLLLNQFTSGSSCFCIVAMCLALARRRGRKVIIRSDSRRIPVLEELVDVTS